MKGKYFLILSGLLCFLIFLLHLIIAIKGGEFYIYFGAGERFAQLSESGSLVPGIITSLLSLIFLVMCLYALSGAKLIRKLPFLRLMLVLFSAIFTLRGLVIIPQAMQANFSLLNRFTIFSGVSLTIGLSYLAGTILNWNQLKAK